MKLWIDDVRPAPEGYVWWFIVSRSDKEILTGRIFGYLTGIGVRDPKSVFYEYPDLFTFDYDYFLEKIDKVGNLEDFVNNVNKDISYIEILYK